MKFSRTCMFLLVLTGCNSSPPPSDNNAEDSGMTAAEGAPGNPSPTTPLPANEMPAPEVPAPVGPVVDPPITPPAGATGYRSFATGSAVTSNVTLDYQDPPCLGPCSQPPAATISYPDGDELTQHPSVIENDTTLRVEVVRKKSTSYGSGSALTSWDTLFIEIPRGATGLVTCSGTGRQGTLMFAGFAGDGVSSTSQPCTFSVTTNSPTELTISFSQLMLQDPHLGVHTIDGTLSIPMTRATPTERRFDSAGQFEVLGDLPGVSGATIEDGPSVVERNGMLQFSATVTDASIPGTAVATVRVHSNALGLESLAAPPSPTQGSLTVETSAGTFDAIGSLTMYHNSAGRLWGEGSHLQLVNRATSLNTSDYVTLSFDVPLLPAAEAIPTSFSQLLQSFEGPSVATGAFSNTLPLGWTSTYPSLTFVTRPTSAASDGSQAMYLQPNGLDYLDVRTPVAGTIRPGETWTVEFSIARDTAYMSPTGSRYGFTVLADNVTLATEADVLLPDAYETRSIVVSLASGETLARALSVSFRANTARMFLDNVRITRTTSPDSAPVTPYVPHVWDPSFEAPGLASAQSTAKGVIDGWVTSSLAQRDYATIWHPDSPGGYFAAADPLASPADGGSLLELGNTSASTLNLSVNSSPFALAEEGRRYRAQVAIGMRGTGLSACPNASVVILAGSTVIGTKTVAVADFPTAGTFGDLTVESRPVAASLAGSDVRLRLNVSSSGSTPLCRSYFDHVRTALIGL